MNDATVELDTTQEEVASPNGHDATWEVFDDDQAFLKHILSKKPAEEVVEVPEWGVKVLCRALNAEVRIEIQMAAYDDKTKRTDYRRVFHTIVMAGCHNPTTGNKIFTASHRETLMRQQDGYAIERLAFAVLRLSHMLLNETERAKKN